MAVSEILYRSIERACWNGMNMNRIIARRVTCVPGMVYQVYICRLNYITYSCAYVNSYGSVEVMRTCCYVVRTSWRHYVRTCCVGSGYLVNCTHVLRSTWFIGYLQITGYRWK